jgi:hypothetical protein
MTTIRKLLGAVLFATPLMALAATAIWEDGLRGALIFALCLLLVLFMVGLMWVGLFLLDE